MNSPDLARSNQASLARWRGPVASAAAALLVVVGLSVPMPAQAELVNGCDPDGITYPAATGEAGFGGGAGTEIDPWLICSRSQLVGIQTTAGTRAAHFKLADDIDLGGSADPWAPLSGTFTGSLNGDYHTISNAVLTTASLINIGLFSLLGGGAQVSKLRLRDFSFTITHTGANSRAGAVAGGYSGGVTLTEIIVEGASISGTIASAGLLLGRGDTTGTSTNIRLAKVSHSSINSNHPDPLNLGGLVGRGRDLVIRRASVTGTSITNSRTTNKFYDNLGGLIGSVSGTSSISETRAAAALTEAFGGEVKAGSIIGDSGSNTLSNVITGGSFSIATSTDS